MSRAHPITRRASLAALVAVVLLNACGQGSDDGSLPAAGYLAAQDIDTVRNLEYQRFRDEQVLVQRCMKEEGFDYILPDPAAFLTVSDGGFVEVPIDMAATLGYGITISLDEAVEPQPDPNSELLARLSETERQAWMSIYYGSGGDGCASAGRSLARTLTDDERVQTAFADEIAAMVDSVAEDPEVVAGEAAWARCMAEQGFDFTAPPESVRLLQDEFALGIPLDQMEAFRIRELAVAMADAECPFNNFGGWETAYEAILQKRQEQFAEDHEAEIFALLEEQGAN